MTIDAASYEADVLELARTRGRAPADLATRYALNLAEPLGDVAFAAHLQTMVNHWRVTARRKRKFEAVVSNLLIEHGQIISELTGIRASPGARPGFRRFAAFRAVRDRRLADLRDRLRAEVRRMSQEHGCLGPSDVEWLVEFCDFAFTGADIGRIAAELHVRIPESRPLPDGSGGATFRQLRSACQILGVALSAEVVFGTAVVREGFRLFDGFRLVGGGGSAVIDRGSLTEALKRLGTARHDDPQTAPRRNVVTILQGIVDKPAIVVEWQVREVVEVVQERARGRIDIGMLITVAVQLGLDRGEAEILAVSLAARAASDPGSLVTATESALASGDLRTAQELVARLSARRGPPPTMLIERVRELTHRFDSLVATADRDYANRPEQAAQALAEALTLNPDDEALARRLAQLPPPVPGSLRSKVAGRSVGLRWPASATRTGEIVYRVSRGEGSAPLDPEQDTCLTDTPSTEYVDIDPPVGLPLYYSIFVARNGGAWSPSVSTGPAFVTVDIAGIDVNVDGQAISATWRPHPRMIEVVVVRRSDEPPASPHDGDQIPVTGRGAFIDRSVVPNTTYFYRVCAVYLLDSRRHVCPGTVVSARVEPPLPEVSDLVVDVRESGGAVQLDARFTAPSASGAVVLTVSTARPSYKVGDIVTADELARMGSRLPGVADRAADGRTRLVCSQALAGRSFVTVAVIAGDRARIGNTVEVAAVWPVRRLAYRREGDGTLLTWVWPPGGRDAEVVWRSDGDPRGRSGSARTTRYRYEAEGGLVIDTGAGGFDVMVRVALPGTGPAVLTPEATQRVPPLPVRVTYTARYDRRHRPHNTTVTFQAEIACEISPLDFVLCPTPYPPTRRGQGRTVHTLDRPQPARKGVPLVLAFDMSDPPHPSWLFCLLPPGSGIEVIPRSMDEVRVV